MSHFSGMEKDKKEILKKMIKKLHEGAEAEKVREEFKEFMKGISSVEIAEIEEELIKEGLPRDKVFQLCDVHLAVFKDSLEKGQTVAPEGHPIHILMEEHKHLLSFVSELSKKAHEIKGTKDFNSIKEELEHLKHIIRHIKDSESHYMREENVLFPSLEKHGITEPPKMMWMEHDKIREMEKDLYKIFESAQGTNFQEFTGRLEEKSNDIKDMLSNHFSKENNILFPASMRVIGEKEWTELRDQFDDIGYCCFTPEPAKMEKEEAGSAVAMEAEGLIHFETGRLSREVLEAIFKTLPVEITFIDAHDTVQYFSDVKDKIFLRTKAILGRKVQNCHPQKSLPLVNQILEEFKRGQRDVAAFWIHKDGKLIYIRYFAVRDKRGVYLGCMEVTQDITEIRKLEGEKRLL